MCNKKQANGLPLWTKIFLCSCSFVQLILLTITITRLPETIPIHFNYRGVIDKYGSPWVFLLPGLLILFISAGLFFMPKSLRNSSTRKMERTKYISDLIITFGLIWLSVLLWSLVYIAFKSEATQEMIIQHLCSTLVFIPLGLFAIIYGNSAATIPPNKNLGFKTRYAFANDDAWRHMQRFGGFCFVAGGIVLTAGAVISVFTKHLFFELIGLAVFIILSIICPFIYSEIKFTRLQN